jgi:hypothetical protein
MTNDHILIITLHISTVTWKPYLNDTAPATDGYYVGNYSDGSAVYVGFGFVPDQNSQPGRLRIEPPFGLHLTIPANSATIIKKDILYMSVSPDCTCSWSALDFNTPGVIMVMKRLLLFFLGHF